jgi:uncharacterized protein DUF1566
VNSKKLKQKIFRVSLKTLPFLILALLFSNSSFAGVQDIGPRAAYEAPTYVPPPPPESKVHLIENGDGTLSDADSNLMWTHKDSYAHLGKCLNWQQAVKYVENLRTGGHDDWRLPDISELARIYDNTKENVISMDHDPDSPLALDEKFADGAAYWYWSSDYHKTKLEDCCARTFYFVNGMAHTRRLTMCSKGGVRAVRGEK